MTRKQILSVEVERIIDQDPDASYLEQAGFEERLDQYHRDIFCYIGIRAKAEILINDLRQTISSGGLWGIESDMDDDYLESVSQEELVELGEQLKALGFSNRTIRKACAVTA